MSHPDEPMPAPPVPTAPLEGAASVPESPVPSGAPYRLPAPPPAPEPPTAELYFGPPPRKPRPLLGPALSVFAVMLWTFVVAGQFASSWMLGAQVRSGEATIMVLFTTFVAWVASMRRSRIAVPPRATFHFVWRAIGAGIAAFVFFVVCVGAASAINSAMDSDFLVGVVLVLISLLAAIFGARLTSPTPVDRTPRERALQIMLWIAGTLLTLVAIVDLGANG